MWKHPVLSLKRNNYASIYARFPPWFHMAFQVVQNNISEHLSYPKFHFESPFSVIDSIFLLVGVPYFYMGLKLLICAEYRDVIMKIFNLAPNISWATKNVESITESKII